MSMLTTALDLGLGIKTNEAKTNPNPNQIENPRSGNPSCGSANNVHIHIASYIQTWVNFCYFLFLVPFKIKRNGKSYQIVQSCFQKIACGIVHFLICGNTAFEVYRSLMKQDKLVFAQVAEGTSHLVFCFMFFRTVWYKKKQFAALILDSDPDQNSRKVQAQVLLACFIQIGFTLTKVFYIFSNLDIAPKDWYPAEFLDQLKQLRASMTSSAHKGNATVSDNVLTAVVCFLRLQRWILVDYGTLLFSIVSWITLQHSRVFYKLLNDASPEETIVVFEAYAKVRDIFQKVSDLIGSMLVVLFCSMVAVYSTKLTNIFYSQHPQVPLLISEFLVMNSATLIMLAEAHHKASRFKTWILTRKKHNIISILGYLEVENSNLAVHGNRFFAITYRFLGSTFSTVLTYSIIFIQFNGSSYK